MTQQIPPGQGPIDPRGAFAPPPPPPGGAPTGWQPPPGPPPGMPPSGYRPMMQMPMYPPMMPPSPRGGAGRAIFMAFLLVILLGSVILNVLLALGMAASSISSHGIVDNTVVSGSQDQTVAIIPLNGIITDSTREQFDRLMAHADEEKNVKALVIEIDSPGGEVTPSDEIYDRIFKFKQEHPGVPVAGTMRSMAASGGYYAACGADYLVAEETTITGSIGVLWPKYNFADLMQKWGIKDTTIVSAGAPFKDAGSPTLPIDPKQEQYLQGLVDHAFDRFKAVVSKSRASKLTAPMDDIANGKALTAEEAKKFGLIDEIGYREKAIAWATKTAALTKPNVVKYEEKLSVLDRFPFAQAQGSPRTQGVNINGVNVNVDRQVLDRITAPRLMYLWQPR